MAIAHQLTAQLSRMANMPAQLLVGYATQIEFWADEVAHCLLVLDTYEQRYHCMLAAQQQVAIEVDPLFHRPISRPGHIAEPHRHHVRGELCRAFAAFVIACHQRANASPDMLRDLCSRLGVNVEL